MNSVPGVSWPRQKLRLYSALQISLNLPRVNVEYMARCRIQPVVYNSYTRDTPKAVASFKFVQIGNRVDEAWIASLADLTLRRANSPITSDIVRPRPR